MTNEEALEILKMIHEMYPRFQLTKRKVKLLIPTLQKMDYTGVVTNLSSYVVDHPYPPLLAEIAAYPEEEDATIAETHVWKAEAKEVSPHVKEQFRQEFEAFVQHKKQGDA